MLEREIAKTQLEQYLPDVIPRNVNQFSHFSVANDRNNGNQKRKYYDVTCKRFEKDLELPKLHAKR